MRDIDLNGKNQFKMISNLILKNENTYHRLFGLKYGFTNLYLLLVHQVLTCDSGILPYLAILSF